MLKLFADKASTSKFVSETKIEIGVPVTGLDPLFHSRAQFMGLSQEHLEAIKSIRPIIMNMVDEGVAIILDHLLKFPSLEAIATSRTSRERLHNVFKTYLSGLFTGNFDEAFHTMRERMGHIHLNAGLPIGWFLATFGAFQSILIPKIIEHLQDNPKQLSTSILAINHLFNLDGQIIVEDFMNSKIAQIEESHAQKLDLRDELLSISQELAVSMENSEASIIETALKTKLIKENTVLTSKSSTNLVNLTHQYEEKIEDMSVSFDSLVEKIEMSISKTESLKDISGQISNMTHEIQKVADQTNLLALNAAIEAARAGHEGRGFTVVANEVRNLAENSKRMSNHIVELISQSTLNIESLVDIMNGMNALSFSSQSNINQVRTGILTVKYEMSNFLEMFNRNAADLDFIADSIQDINQSTHNLTKLSSKLFDKAENL
nr:globin-coupled sensor protein [Bacillus sp. FJAT-29937]